jgi:hypothetical protein
MGADEANTCAPSAADVARLADVGSVAFVDRGDHPTRIESIYRVTRGRSATLILGREGLGEADEADFLDWVDYVSERIDEATGLDVTVGVCRPRDVQTDAVTETLEREYVLSAVQDLWGTYCAEGGSGRVKPCYGYQIVGRGGEVLDSCWGFYGELEYVRGEARSAAESTDDPTIERAAEELAGRVTYAGPVMS